MDTQRVSLWRVLLKAVLLLLIAALLFSAFNPMLLLGRLSLYNSVFPGRQRLPYGDDPQHAYNLNLYSLEAMFASHVVAAGPKPADEYRVLLIGDSSVWGFLLENQDTLTADLNAAGLHAPDGRRVAFYNLGHPTISLTKDLMILDYALQYQPDLILWPVTLEAFPWSKQTSSPLVQNNPARVGDLIARYDLPLDPHDPAFVEPTLWSQTLIGQRRNLADLLRLQLYGVMWAATGIDMAIPEQVEQHAVDLEPDTGYGEFQPPDLNLDDLAFPVLDAGIQRAGEVPVLIINEPIYVSDGANSDIRYNAFYPRWAYDQYRQLLDQQAAANGWNYVDLWQAAGNAEFTNTPIHLTPQGTLQLSQSLIATLHETFNLQP